MAQDPFGMMWIATEQGLNRYDGYEMRLYGSSPGDALRDIGRTRILSLQANETELWIGTDYLVRFDYATEKFKKFPVSDGQGIYSIKKDKNGHLWLGGYQFGLIQFDPKTERILASYSRLGSGCTVDPTTIINDLAFADDGRLWLATSKGVCIFNPDDKEFSRPSRNRDLNTVHATSLDWDENNRLWIATHNGLYRTDASGVIRKFNTGNVPVEHIKSLLVDSKQRVWVGLDRDGVLVINTKNDTYVHIQPQINTSFSLGPGAVYSIFETQNQTIWISVKGFGLYLYDVNKQLFDLFSANDNTPGSLGYPQVLSMASDQDDSLWIATDGGGLFRMNKETESFTVFKHNPQQPSSLPSNAVIGLNTDDSGALWIGSWAGGLSRLDTQTGKFESWGTKQHPEFWTDNIFALYQDSHSHLWISAWDHGVQVFDPEKEQVVRSYRGSPGNDSLNNINIMAMLESHDGDMWLGGYSGLDRIDHEGRYIENYGINSPISLSGSTVYALHEDANDLLFIGTNAGLNILDRESSSMRYIGISDGLPGKAIYGILEDEEGDIWLSTNRGLALYYRASGKIQTFSTAHGLQGDEFNRFSYHKSADMFYFGGVNGFNRFNPLEVKYSGHNHLSQIALTDFLISNRSITPGTHYALPKAINHMERVTLKPEDSVFSIQFASTTLSLSRSVSYQYQLQGFDDKWISTGSDNRRATYTALPSGEYVFKAQVLGANQAPMGAAASVIIEILPLWRETNTFRITVIALLVSLLTLAYHLRVKRMIQRMDTQQKKREAFIYLAKNQKLEALNVELVSVNDLKDDLLRIVAHDLRNPLAGMKMGLDLMIDEQTEENIAPTPVKLDRIKSGVLSMLAMVDKLLSDNDADLLLAEQTSVSVASVVAFVTEQNSAQAQLKNITLVQQWETTRSLSIIADETLLYQALDNLLSNALKFSYADSLVTITVGIISDRPKPDDTGQERLKAFLAISDQGQGMTTTDLESVFQPHANLSAQPTQGEPSYGMGLYNTSKVVAAMHGKISVETEGRNKGCTFTIVLPLCASDL